MARQTLSRVTLQTLENYHAAATKAVAAYRFGGHRLVRVVDDALENAVYARTVRMVPRAARRVNEARGNVSKLVVNAIDRVARGTERALDAGSTTAAAQLHKVARFTAGIDNPMVANGLQTAARLTMPYAQVALALSGKVVEGASALAQAAGVRPARKAAVRKPATRTRKAVAKTRTVVKAQTRKVAEAVKPSRATAAKARRTVRAAVKPVAEAVAA
jgi:hypothetical protein